MVLKVKQMVELSVDVSRYSSTQDLIILSCYKCGSPVAMTSDHYRRARESEDVDFFCSHGHGQAFVETEVNRIRRQLERAQERANASAEAERVAKEQRDAAEKAHRALNKRVHAGVCPECHRSFQNMARHMKSKHAQQSHGGNDDD